MALPDLIQYGQVKWRVVSAVADSADGDALPDAVPVTGTVVFTPSATVLLATGAAPVTVIGTAVTCNLDTDGVLRDAQGRDLISLVATNSTGITPTGWTWGVSYRLNGGLSRGSFSFALPAGSVVDLTTAAPVGSSNGAQIIKGDPGGIYTLIAGENIELAPNGDAITISAPGGSKTDYTDTRAVSAVGAVIVVHGSNATAPRPSVNVPVIWYGTVTPTNSDPTRDVTNYVTAAPEAIEARQELSNTSWLQSTLLADQPLATTSANFVSRLVAQTQIGPSSTPVQGQSYTGYPYNMTVDAGAFSVPRYTMPANATTQRVWITAAGASVFQSFCEAVPMPNPALLPGGTIAPSGTDGSVVIEQGGKVWDFWQLRPRDANTPAGYAWQATTGGYHPNAAAWTGWYPTTGINPATGQTNGYYWGTAACGVTQLGGRLMAEDYARGSINHKIAVALPITGPGKLNPATRYDAGTLTITQGAAADAVRLPEGACFRLPAGFDTVAWAAAHHSQASAVVVEMVCRAIRDYGLFVNDTSGVVGFAAEGAKTFGTPYNPHTVAPDWGNFGHDLPWSQMQQITPTNQAGV